MKECKEKCNRDCNSTGFASGYLECDISTTPTCNCIKGFIPKNAMALALVDVFNGCLRGSPLSCGDTDGFWLLRNVIVVRDKYNHRG
ncbi:hypothetical protein F2Q69_00031875 [Brassica cretica]|uniref:Uncharacterized protein n=1 Tax=Brassica cretica TaxID=69181 RepID=A0A8S9RVE6_BRACR|nr:hypothetical protein F2Q69_00031875 [Brassica cretica]